MRILAQWERMKVKLQNNDRETFMNGSQKEHEEARRKLDMYESIDEKMKITNGRIDLEDCTTQERKFFWKLVRDRDYMDTELGI